MPAQMTPTNTTADVFNELIEQRAKSDGQEFQQVISALIEELKSKYPDAQYKVTAWKWGIETMTVEDIDNLSTTSFKPDAFLRKRFLAAARMDVTHDAPVVDEGTPPRFSANPPSSGSPSSPSKRILGRPAAKTLPKEIPLLENFFRNEIKNASITGLTRVTVEPKNLCMAQRSEQPSASLAIPGQYRKWKVEKTGISGTVVTLEFSGDTRRDRTKLNEKILEWDTKFGRKDYPTGVTENESLSYSLTLCFSGSPRQLAKKAQSSGRAH